MLSRNLCRTSGAAAMYWAIVSVLVWIGLSAIGLIWRPLHATSAITVLFAMSAGCVANWARYRTCHCYVDGPLFFAGAAAFFLRQLGVVQFPSFLVWLLLALGVAISFYLEWHLASGDRC